MSLGEMYDVMAGPQIKYRIYPSLLDKYQSLIDYEIEAAQPWNIVSEKAVAENRYPGKEAGDYILDPDEMYAKIEKELIDTINRVPKEPSEAADKGTAFNEVIDCLIEKRKCTRADMTIQSIRVNGEPISIRSDFNGFSFNFDVSLCRLVREYLGNSMCQVLLKAPIMTKFGGVCLYGYADYIKEGTIIDLKTTSQYEFGKFQHKWQRHVYPWVAVESGMCERVNAFIYYVVQFNKQPTINGKLYAESYVYDHNETSHLLLTHLESFIDWLESHKDQITDLKIFNKAS